MAGKRDRSPSDSGKVKAGEKAAKPPKRPSPVKKISNGSLGKMERSAEALLSLNTKKTEEEIWADVTTFQRRTTDSDFDPQQMFKIITWNVAGLRGMLKKDDAALKDFLAAEQPDILCLQETKLNVDDAAGNAKLGVVDGYAFVDHPCAYKKGYSGTRTYMRTHSMVEQLHARCTRGFTLPSDNASVALSAPLVEGTGDEEGRILTTFLSPESSTSTPPSSSSVAAPRLAVVNTYVPNSGMTLDRLPLRVQSFDPLMREYLKKLDDWSSTSGKSGGSKSAAAAAAPNTTPPPHGFIWTGDLNVAERDYDRYYAGTFKTMQECSGFTPEERNSFRQTVATTDAVDVFRSLYPNAAPAYTFWSMRINGRAKGLGWRLDYFVVSSRLMPFVVDCFPMPNVTKSDHCPVQLWMRKP
ncbi:apurinic/apyrimidinic endonuclease-redox proteinAP-endonuclease [Leptomonas pyrrhocoris]|uniref:DNA-(apurinic or apyrimidinic site) endonuclease n=1 Tax=Leptomonas pyrrhocoris TaxID=157538 RepID=A0A0M9FXC2_LEPPY|nr:apurinic/apyrimidinic endonuclease-redox proteinAP-endonuclease [Leptomonas pyrrhocoris]XP_015656309.1 apurinic/apyrimidinic endonuclease-redox proteinAP-endonuclease [Leptomonas pyrrhocoris]KPA77869.1 apurinic/apyrimidinic endonuclease-redox proteinAP-endonuclease [Leptomonas pyrrhocoris]KPA77870.1 apurinic/apyrimidinic endonuclease-redox proteinAP-endonuclease [Leptomonas pyrrhocoris]|eukprot:XP_015656308.1 apurinic/apyrimidinic endonuclease-redox proteinAP-endonuclease [Leptomonas pyrrhocoris]